MQIDKNTNKFKWKQTTSRLSSHTEFPCGITVGTAETKSTLAMLNMYLFYLQLKNGDSLTLLLKNYLSG